MEIFQNVKLGEVISVRGGKRLPVGCNLSKELTKHPYIRARDIGNGQITFNDPVYLDESTFLCIKNYIVNKGDACITIVGANVGDVGFVPDFLDGGNLTENAVRLFPKKNNFDKKFLGYCLLTEDIKLQMKQLAGGGAAQPKLGLYKIKELEIPSPSIDIQQRVASILSTYSDLIENNEKRIKILESIAQKLYTEWFVKFKFPGHEKVKMIDSGNPNFGMIPDGWLVGKLSDVLENIKISSKPGQHLSSRKYVPIELIPRKNITLKEYASWKEAQSSLILFEKGDILFGAMRPYFHKVSVASFPGVTRQTCFVLRPKGVCYKSFGALTAFSEKVVSFASGNTKGATIPYTSWEGVLSGCSIVIPDSFLLNKFETVIWKMIEEQMILSQTNSNLVKARDRLIPQLVTGKIEIK